MTDLKPCIIFDIDGTLANLQHRVHLVNGPKKDWPEFFRLITKDAPIEQTIRLNKILSDNMGEMPIFLASGRSENERTDTINWLRDNGVRYQRLFMRPAGDYRKDTIIKEEILGQIRSLGYEPWLIFDDRQCVTDMWRKNGCFVLQCDPNPAEVLHDSFQFHENYEFPLTIMVGPSGAGKTSFIASKGYITDRTVISSDNIRTQICGDFRIQERNKEVFEIFHELALENLRRGIPVVLDATHLKNADRLKSARLVSDKIPIQYVVINRPVNAKIATAGWRKDVSVKGKTLIEYHEQVFQSNIKDILAGDNLPNVTVLDLRK